MIQDIYPHSFDISYRADRIPEADSLLIRLEGRSFLCRKDPAGSVVLPKVSECSVSEKDLIYLFALDGKSVFLSMGEEALRAEGHTYEDISVFRNAQPRETMLAAVTAYHLYMWYRDNAYCGHCGEKMIHDDKERMQRCPACGNTVYPRIMPSVIVGVIKEDSILLTRYNREGASLSALVAGFCEIGETAEDTVRREVMEETGIKVKNIRYYASQPWGITAGGLLLGFYCDADGDGEIRADGEEIAEAVWVKREDLQEYAGKEHASLTAEMIGAFASGKEV